MNMPIGFKMHILLTTLKVTYNRDYKIE